MKLKISLNNLASPNTEITEKEQKVAYLIGALRDGTFTINKKYYVYRIRFYQKNKEWLQNLSKMFQQIFNKEPRLIQDKRDDVWQLIIDSKEIFEFLTKISEFSGSQRHWRTPRWILEGSSDTQREYIRGFFDAEGGVPHVDTKTFKPKDMKIYFSQANKECLEELKLMLNNLQIKTGRVSGPYYKKGYNHPVFGLRIQGIKEINKFSKTIGTIHPDKIRRFELISLFKTL